jgi:hypothetical protein
MNPSISSTSSYLLAQIARIVISMSLTQFLHRWLGWPSSTMNPQTASLLLQQPLDIVNQILENLPPESAVAIALTCKLAFRAFFPAMRSRLEPESLEDLLLLLEKSVSRDLFYFHSCRKLHRYSSFWAPSIGCKSSLAPPCKPKAVNLGGMHIAFYHVRLVMNEHLLGRGNGLHLDRFKQENVPFIFDNPFPAEWGTTTEARILQDQLFLKISHQLKLHRKYWRNCEDIRSEEHYICPHYTTHLAKRDPFDLAAIIPKQVPPLSPCDWLSKNFNHLEECENIRTSCTICLTDFITSLKLERTDPNDPDLELLHITIISYHQFGHCRSPSDLKWRTFLTHRLSDLPDYIANANRRIRSFYTRRLDLCDQTNYIIRTEHLGPDYEQGSVQRIWDTGAESVVIH